ncbi:asparagine synthase [Azospirillum sp. TSH100]|uniref:asparagine synthase (glutamine-hydrolyzing) n=1 Tax=Azospirillum sp. TSH100 TaxID=652764 RepID=UPI000D62123E|nr:asparagine synthase (glutamine-hydrolyzing) [Azospirillum sp. TSH100]PWC90785.1 asparagine synthase [Azospirillum sp. TSH100]QCG90866.1 asparagine synthase (glutamine-hydrolyzing) [Azospirillum sp. TSH100]
MCGILGFIGPTLAESEGRRRLAAMADALRHRGPDDEGFFQAPGVGLGFRRLSIVDLVSGNQPVFSTDGTVVSVCNGEIYNHRELRAELEQRGHRFRTRSDTEVLPALYQEYGPEFAARMNGQFAFAVYDLTRRRLVLGRDHVGIAPLFHAEVDGGLAFGSEIKALLRHPDVPRRVDLTGLDQILTFPGPVSPRTLFAGVESLPPGTVLVVDGDGQRRRITYWDLDYPTAAEIDDSRSAEECVEELDAALRQAVRYRLQADVPVGGYLSGGLDSSLIAALVAELTPDVQRHTFSITFQDRRIDESAHQRLMARRLGTLHHETVVGPEQIHAHLTNIVRHAEAPLRESYNACSLILSRMVRDQDMKVVLTGEGADELFGGYVGYRLDVHRAQEEADPTDLDALLEAQLRERLWGDPGFLYEKNYRAAAETRQALYSQAVAKRFAGFDCLNGAPVDVRRLAGRHPFHKRSYLDFKLRMADHLLADHGDRVAFANSVEARYPFLDVNVIDVARRIPPSLMVRDGEEKHLLKRLARRYLPAEIVDRQKFSFVAPSSAVLLRQNIPLVEELLSQERIRRDGYFNPDTVEHLKRLYRQPGRDLNQTFEDDLLMVVLTFGILLDTFELPAFS